jgi:hypothetical protein
MREACPVLFGDKLTANASKACELAAAEDEEDWRKGCEVEKREEA